MNAHIENRPYHEAFMREAIDMAEQALAKGETPVGCVFVHNGTIIGRGMNDTNRSKDGTRHCEFMALSQILRWHKPAILHETDLYVTVEPCIMCASALRQYGIRAVYFGCANLKFGGTSGVLQIHSDKMPLPPYPAYGNLFREEAILLLRRFYVQQNDKAPEPKQKKNRQLKTDIIPVNNLPTEPAHLETPTIPGTPVQVIVRLPPSLETSKVTTPAAPTSSTNKATTGTALALQASKTTNIAPPVLEASKPTATTTTPVSAEGKENINSHPVVNSRRRRKDRRTKAATSSSSGNSTTTTAENSPAPTFVSAPPAPEALAEKLAEVALEPIASPTATTAATTTTHEAAPPIATPEVQSTSKTAVIVEGAGEMESIEPTSASASATPSTSTSRSVSKRQRRKANSEARKAADPTNGHATVTTTTDAPTNGTSTGVVSSKSTVAAQTPSKTSAITAAKSAANPAAEASPKSKPATDPNPKPVGRSIPGGQLIWQKARVQPPSAVATAMAAAAAVAAAKAAAEANRAAAIAAAMEAGSASTAGTTAGSVSGSTSATTAASQASEASTPMTDVTNVSTPTASKKGSKKGSMP